MDSFSNKSYHSRATSRRNVPLRPHTSHSIADSNNPSHTMTSSAPRPIPDEKLEEALDLYSKYQTALAEEALAERNAAHHLQPTNWQARSISSRHSSKHPRLDSGSTSEFDRMSDISSVVDFNGNEKPSKALSVSYKGKVVKQTRRSAFTPAKKLKTHLIRLLGSCPACAPKKTPVGILFSSLSLMLTVHQSALWPTRILEGLNESSTKDGKNFDLKRQALLPLARILHKKLPGQPQEDMGRNRAFRRMISCIWVWVRSSLHFLVYRTPCVITSNRLEVIYYPM